MAFPLPHLAEGSFRPPLGLNARMNQVADIVNAWRLLPDGEEHQDGHATVAEDEEKDDEKYGYQPQEEEPDENPPVESGGYENPPPLASSSSWQLFLALCGK